MIMRIYADIETSYLVLTYLEECSLKLLGSGMPETKIKFLLWLLVNFLNRGQ